MSFTTYSRIAEQIERLLGKYTDDSDVKRQELVLHVKQRVAHKTMERFYATKSDEFASVDGALVVPFKSVTVEYDTDMESYFFELPSATTSLLYGMGIKSVSPNKAPKRDYIPVANGFNGIYEDLYSSRLQNRIGYYVENDKVYFVNMDASNNPSTVNVKLVAPIDNVADDVNINIPPDMQSEVILEIFKCTQVNHLLILLTIQLTCND